MPTENENETESTEEIESTEDETTEVDEGLEDSDDEQESEEEQGSTLSDEDAKQALSKVRKESASYRRRLRDLESKLENVESLDEVQSLIEQAKQAAAAEAHALVVENVALKFNLPSDLAEALKGSTREELEAHAKTLAKYAPQSNTPDPKDLQGGLDPRETGGGDVDPVAASRKARRRGF